MSAPWRSVVEFYIAGLHSRARRHVNARSRRLRAPSSSRERPSPMRALARIARDAARARASPRVASAPAPALANAHRSALGGVPVEKTSASAFSSARARATSWTSRWLARRGAPSAGVFPPPGLRRDEPASGGERSTARRCARRSRSTPLVFFSSRHITRRSRSFAFVDSSLLRLVPHDDRSLPGATAGFAATAAVAVAAVTASTATDPFYDAIAKHLTVGEIKQARSRAHRCERFSPVP